MLQCLSHSKLSSQSSWGLLFLGTLFILEGITQCFVRELFSSYILHIILLKSIFFCHSISHFSAYFILLSFLHLCLPY